jgi:hypothetical protein
MRWLQVTFVLFFALVGCDWGQPSVRYTNNGSSVECHGNDDASVFDSGRSLAYTCVWYCARYKGESGLYVSLTWWARNGGPYVLESEYVSSGICR